MHHSINNDWATRLSSQFEQPYYQELLEFLEEEYKNNVVFPAKDKVFTALNETSYDSVKAVILGQDPYHGEGQAEGLSFSVQPEVKLPPSLRNIFIELQDDIGCEQPANGSLMKWAKEGVLLLNTVLTVRKGSPNSHKGKGWERLTDEVISHLNRREEPIVFILWGKHAGEKKQLITSPQHHIIESPHPSPFSARKGFFGSKPFSKTNAYLKQHHIREIDWSL
ncbi:uracil-DNA glycosylase [Metabacillus niabensis]|uniref:Uracil-DNA glycosylase n=1 Tax=Metabacillus niabensis TaxID=324854 RepID=A0ABT9Z3U5_9BACI|nr:uracil-DNA glycosylase [Metabacillus niabensis]MDQ0226680.1 uracil-DNA glycosylase [Metabacillus niabensis]PAD68977.1 uracil-DNA glycosylase [Bacillus sp. 7586-K]